MAIATIKQRQQAARRAEAEGLAATFQVCSVPRWPSRPRDGSSSGGSRRPSTSFDASDDDTLVLRQEYLEAVIHKPFRP